MSAHKDKVDKALNDIINLRDKEPENISITHGHAFHDCAFQIPHEVMKRVLDILDQHYRDERHELIKKAEQLIKQ